MRRAGELLVAFAGLTGLFVPAAAEGSRVKVTESIGVLFGTEDGVANSMGQAGLKHVETMVTSLQEPFEYAKSLSSQTAGSELGLTTDAPSTLSNQDRIAYSFCPRGGGSRTVTTASGGIGDAVTRNSEYPSDQECRWRIAPEDIPIGSKVELTFSFFDLQTGETGACSDCGCDYVQIYDGDERDAIFGMAGTEIGPRLCGSYDRLNQDQGSALRFVSSGERGLTVVFVADTTIEGLGFRAEWQTIEPTEPKLVLARPVIFSPVGATEVTVDVQCVACDGLEFSSDLTLLERKAKPTLDYEPLNGGTATLSWDGSTNTQSVNVQIIPLPSGGDERVRIARDFLAILQNLVPEASSEVPTLASNRPAHNVTRSGTGQSVDVDPYRTTMAVWLLPEEALVQWAVQSVEVDDEALDVTLNITCSNCAEWLFVAYVLSRDSSAIQDQDFAAIEYGTGVSFTGSGAEQVRNVTIRLLRNLGRADDRSFFLQLAGTGCAVGSNCLAGNAFFECPDPLSLRDRFFEFARVCGPDADANDPYAVRFGPLLEVTIRAGEFCGKGVRLEANRTTYTHDPLSEDATPRASPLLESQHRALANSSICDQGLVTLNLTSWRDINASEVQRIDNYCNGAVNQSTASQESCDERNDCIVQAEYQGQQEFKTICACPFDKTGKSCQGALPSTCELKMTPFDPSANPSSGVSQGPLIGSEACISSGEASAGSAGVTNDALPTRFQELDPTFGGYDTNLDGVPPCVLMDTEADVSNTTMPAATLVLECGFVDPAAAIEGVDALYAEELRQQEWNWSPRSAPDALENAGYPSPIPLIYSGSAYNFSYAIQKDGDDNGSSAASTALPPPAFAATTLPSATFRAKTFDLARIHDDTYAEDIVLGGEAWAGQTEFSWTLPEEITRNPGRFASGGRIYTEFKLSAAPEGVETVPFRRHYVELLGWRSPPAESERLSDVSIWLLCVGIVLLFALVLYCVRARRLRIEDEKEERERVSARIAQAESRKDI